MASAKRKRAKPAKGDRINLDDHPDYHILLGEVVMSNGKQLSECTHADMAKFTMADREFLIAEGLDASCRCHGPIHGQDHGNS